MNPDAEDFAIYRRHAIPAIIASLILWSIFGLRTLGIIWLGYAGYWFLAVLMSACLTLLPERIADSNEWYGPAVRHLIPAIIASWVLSTEFSWGTVGIIWLGYGGYWLLVVLVDSFRKKIKNKKRAGDAQNLAAK
jgi:hypothetical protein